MPSFPFMTIPPRSASVWLRRIAAVGCTLTITVATASCSSDETEQSPTSSASSTISSTTVVEVPPRLTTASNFRDLAGGPGGGYITADGHTVRPGVVYRSDALALTPPQDVAAIEPLGMSTIFDLRTTAEAEKKPDVEIPPGAEYTRVNIIGDSPEAAALVGSLESIKTVEAAGC